MAFKLKELDGDLGEILANLTSPKPMVLERKAWSVSGVVGARFFTY